jgi:hypothetical protein
MGKHLETSQVTTGNVLLWLGILGFSAAAGALITLFLVVTPKDRAGGPLLRQALNPIVNQLGLSEDPNLLDGGELALHKPDTSPKSEARFIVRFADSDQAGKTLYVFRENRARGSAAFKAWAEQQERFRGFELKTVTPAGEAVLAIQVPFSRSPDEAHLKQLTRQLTDAPEVIYADPAPFLIRASGRS